MPRIESLNLPSEINGIFTGRRSFSEGRIVGLKANLENSDRIKSFPQLSIFIAGSYGRQEASSYSDIDLFFVSNLNAQERQGLNLKQISMLSATIDVAERSNFLTFSNDGQFLRVLFLDEILSNLGNEKDDYYNFFTARLLMILEGRPVYNESLFNEALDEVIKSYFRDYRYHPKDFKPTFLINDIIRFWKTLCLNYENKRNVMHNSVLSPEKKIKQSVKNFKLKYSRLLTCFASVLYLCKFGETISPDDVRRMCALTPIERIISAVSEDESLMGDLASIVKSYSWFMEQTALSTEMIEEKFRDKEFTLSAFSNAEEFGQNIYSLLCRVAGTNEKLRYLVI
jgi:predicted nucleotidyltransferase